MKPQLLGNVSYISKWQRIMGSQAAEGPSDAIHWDPCTNPEFSNLQHSRFVSIGVREKASHPKETSSVSFCIFPPLLNLLPVTSPH